MEGISVYQDGGLGFGSVAFMVFVFVIVVLVIVNLFKASKDSRRYLIAVIHLLALVLLMGRLFL